MVVMKMQVKTFEKTRKLVLVQVGKLVVADFVRGVALAV
jgi:hypothetical protein